MSTASGGGPFRQGPAGALVDVRVIPRSPRAAIGGLRDGRLLVRVTAPPVDQAANEAVVRVIASALDVAKGAVRVVAGHTSRNKVIEIRGASSDGVRTRLDG